jgi:hypothetical protein
LAIGDLLGMGFSLSLLPPMRSPVTSLSQLMSEPELVLLDIRWEVIILYKAMKVREVAGRVRQRFGRSRSDGTWCKRGGPRGVVPRKVLPSFPLCSLHLANPMCAFSGGRARSSVLGVRLSASDRIRYRVSGTRRRVPGTQQRSRDDGVPSRFGRTVPFPPGGPPCRVVGNSFGNMDGLGCPFC